LVAAFSAGRFAPLGTRLTIFVFLVSVPLVVALSIVVAMGGPTWIWLPAIVVVLFLGVPPRRVGVRARHGDDQEPVPVGTSPMDRGAVDRTVGWPRLPVRHARVCHSPRSPSCDHVWCRTAGSAPGGAASRRARGTRSSRGHQVSATDAAGPDAAKHELETQAIGADLA
jgi:hypothetical protein